MTHKYAIVYKTDSSKVSEKLQIKLAETKAQMLPWMADSGNIGA